MNESKHFFLVNRPDKHKLNPNKGKQKVRFLK